MFVIEEERRNRTGGILEDNLGPALIYGLVNMKTPVDGFQEQYFVLVDFQSVETGDLTPGTRRVVAVLQIFRCQDQGGQKHPTTTLQGPRGKSVAAWLLHGEVVLWDMGLDQDQVVKSHLQGAITRAGPSQRLLNKSTKGEDRFTPEGGITSRCHD
jgi:hypothetical protein